MRCENSLGFRRAIILLTLLWKAILAISCSLTFSVKKELKDVKLNKYVVVKDLSEVIRMMHHIVRKPK